MFGDQRYKAKTLPAVLSLQFFIETICGQVFSAGSSCPSKFARAAMTKYLKLGGLKPRQMHSLILLESGHLKRDCLRHVFSDALGKTISFFD